MTDKKETNDGKRIGLIILSVLVAIYIIGTVIFSYIALPGTFLNGKDISYASKKEALDTAPDDFGLTVTGRDDRDLIINPTDIDYHAELPNDAKIDQNPFSWPAALVNNKKENFDFEYKVSYDKEKLDKIIDDSKLMNGITEPQNAKLGLKDGNFVIENEVMGNKLDKEKLKKSIIDNINTKSSKLALDDSYYYNPEVTSKSEKLQKALADAEKVKEMSIDFDFNGFDLKLENDSLLELFDMTENGLELNYDRVYDYAKYLANETDTYGKNRKFNATGIGEIVVGPGVYGFKLDVDGMVDKIYEQINARKSGIIEPVYANVAYTRTETGGDIGDTYVEVDLSRQHMWFYKDGDLILESDLVSGKPVDSWASNVGVGQILNKVPNTTLTGFNFDGQSQYNTPVDYWIPIGWDGEGFHDAPWRGSFGGSIYLQNGSHGCYNLPPSVAGALFENVDHVTPVVVYESSTNYSPGMVY